MALFHDVSSDGIESDVISRVDREIEEHSQVLHRLQNERLNAPLSSEVDEFFENTIEDESLHLAHLYFRRGMYHVRYNFLKNAERDFTSALKIDPDNLLYLRWRIHANRKLGETKKVAVDSLYLQQLATTTDYRSTSIRKSRIY